MRHCSWLAAAVLLSSAPAGAQAAAELPDPSAIELPDIGHLDAKTQGEGYKFFYFYNPSVTFAEAYSDIVECRSFLEAGAVRALPTFVPWVETQKFAVPPRIMPSPYGVVGAVVGAIIEPKLERGVRNNKLRRCMEPRGYHRYAVAEDAWQKLNEGDEKTLILMQAKLASGPMPEQPEVTG
jgi:hypothetical protein